MSEEQKPTTRKDADTGTSTQRDVDALRIDEGPLKQEGDALRDGSGSRQGQSPPNVGPTESR